MVWVGFESATPPQDCGTSMLTNHQWRPRRPSSQKKNTKILFKKSQYDNVPRTYTYSYVYFTNNKNCTLYC